jgi:hypothetical protein
LLQEAKVQKYNFEKENVKIICAENAGAEQSATRNGS